jgi:DNA-binding transcriptional MerR regulator/methylmalonyl-CoA mutase cobalamin-binding subunit
MSTASENPGVTLDISAVERETGLSKDVLRMWERRYGFPKPGRDENGERAYAPDEVARLRAIKRLMDIGMRPGKIVRCTPEELAALTDQRIDRRREAVAPAVERDFVKLLQEHDAAGLQQTLVGLLMRQGLHRFVLETMAPLNRAVGDAWMRGAVQIFEEHLYTEQLQIALRTAINAFPRPAGPPRLLLTTFPGEQHGLGLLMVEAMLVPERVQCISLGLQTPQEDIRRAALAHRADVVALSFSSAFPVRQASEGLVALRRELPPTVAMWAGGEMTRRVRKSMPGVVLLPDLAALPATLSAWRERSVANPASAAHRTIDDPTRQR